MGIRLPKLLTSTLAHAFKASGDAPGGELQLSYSSQRWPRALTTATFAATGRTLAGCTSAATEIWTQLVFGQLAILILVELLKGCNGTLNFLGGNLTVAITVQCAHHREHPHKTTWSSLTFFYFFFE